MYQVHDWAEVHRLFHREDWSKADIAEKLGMSRNTVSRLLRLSEPPVYERTPAVSKLDPHRGSIAQMLSENPKAAATVIRERLRRDGYEGGITILKDYLSEIRPLFVDAQSYQRTSYLPGEIAQTDWWEPGISVPVGKGAWREVFGLVTTLPHSAAHAAVFCYSQQMGDFLPAFSGTMSRFGGVPEKMVVDRDSSIVVPHSHPARLHTEVAALFGAFRTKGVILSARSPEKKGQVERTIGYLETSFLPLRSFTDIVDLQLQHDRWAKEVAYQRRPRRLGGKVVDAFSVERGFLHPLPDRFPDTDRRTEVRVTKDGFCRVGDVDYSVPPGYGGRRLSVQSSWTQVVIFSEGKEIARHRRSFVPADVVLSGEHARALRMVKEARGRLREADQEITDADLSRYDRLIGVRR